MKKFTYNSTVYWDELDALQMLHNARFPAHVERAVLASYQALGGRWTKNLDENPDQMHVVKELRIEYLNPVVGPSTMRIDVWIEKLGTTSCVYGFTCASEDGNVSYARGERTIVKIDPQSRKPAPWSETFRQRVTA